MALAAGLDQAAIEAINAGEQPNFTDRADRMVHSVARELLATGSLGDDTFKAAESTLGYQRLADRGNRPFLSNRDDGVVGAESDAPSHLKRSEIPEDFRA